MTKEIMVVGFSREDALRRLKSEFDDYIAWHVTTKWHWKIEPEAQKYEGVGDHLKGKWRAYGRIQYEG